MWFVVAIGLGFCYLVLGIVAVNLQHFICAAYRQQYFSAIIRQRMIFFDDENNSVGTLASRVQGDPKQLEELLGMNMGMVVSSVLQLCGSLTIAFVFGWKLALVATCVTVPIGLVCAWYRFKYEMEFEKLSAAVSYPSHSYAPFASCPSKCSTTVMTRGPVTLFLSPKPVHTPADNI